MIGIFFKGFGIILLLLLTLVELAIDFSDRIIRICSVRIAL
jgi:hypothetical protein